MGVLGLSIGAIWGIRSGLDKSTELLSSGSPRCYAPTPNCLAGPGSRVPMTL